MKFFGKDKKDVLSTSQLNDLGYKLFISGDNLGALKCYDDSLSISPCSATLVSKAQVLARMKKYNESIDACDKALELESGDAIALVEKARALTELGKRNGNSICSAWNWGRSRRNLLARQIH
jgi:tetratricopeptide (TPR) repeat protein